MSGTRWQVASINGEPQPNWQEDQLAASPASIEFFEEHAEVFGGCNGFQKSYSLSNSRIRFGTWSFRFVGCEDAVMRWEKQANQAFDRARCAQVSGQTLVLSGWRTEITLQPQPAE